MSRGSAGPAPGGARGCSSPEPRCGIRAGRRASSSPARHVCKPCAKHVHTPPVACGLAPHPYRSSCHRSSCCFHQHIHTSPICNWIFPCRSGPLACGLDGLDPLHFCCCLLSHRDGAPWLPGRGCSHPAGAAYSCRGAAAKLVSILLQTCGKQLRKAVQAGLPAVPREPSGRKCTSGEASARYAAPTLKLGDCPP